MREAQRRLMWKLPYYARRFDAPATYALIAAMAIVFVADFLSGGSASGWLAWSPSVAWLSSGQYWRPLTFPLAHGAGGNAIFAVLFDGMLLYFFGASLERAWGSAKFLFFFISSGVLAGLVLIPQTSVGPVVPIFTGMAGSFVAIAVAFAALNPFATMLFWFVPMQVRWFALIVIAFDLFSGQVRYGGPIQALLAVTLVSVYAYLFATRRASLPSLGGMSGRGGPSLRERFDRWQQRRRMRRWQRRVSKIERPEDLFKDH